jgi:hypothetical protein
MNKAYLIENKKRSSFIEVSNSSNETDDYDDDDEEVSTAKKNNNFDNEKGKLLSNNQKNTGHEYENQELYLLETRMNNHLRRYPSGKISSENESNKTTRKIDKKKADIFIQNQMNKLQKSRTFKQSNRENIYEAFNKGSASLGKHNADEFVSFLGYLRDASSRASQLLAKKEQQKLMKLIKGTNQSGDIAQKN